MNEEKKLGILFVTVFSTVAFALGWYLHPDTKEVYVCPNGFGQYDTFSDKPECPYVVNEKVISIFAEKKECEEKGGNINFEIDKTKTPWPLKITCTKPPEIIFSYDLTN